VAAGAGVRIAKHGNRAASGRFGSADLLEALGVNIDAEPKTVQRCINEIGIGFMFAPRFHLAMKYAIGARKRIGTRTIFNILGPLANPAGAKRQLLGVYNPGLTEVMANVLKNLGSRHALVVCADDGIDEISIEGLTKVTELKEDGSIDTYRVRAKDFGLKESSLETIETASREENIEIAMSVLKGKSGPARDVILLNASAALIAGLKASDFKEGLKMAAESIDSEKALEKLHKLADLTKR
jgi:anthranilate phosphoribosyltransferase